MAGRGPGAPISLDRPEQRYEFGWVLLAAAHAMLGHDAETATAREAVLAITPSFSAETGLSSNWRIMRDQERQRFIDGLRKAGLPVCAAPSAEAGLSPRNRLPECDTKRTKVAGSKT